MTDRTDFLQQLRRKDDPDRANHKRDLMNHLSNNVYEIAGKARGDVHR